MSSGDIVNWTRLTRDKLNKLKNQLQLPDSFCMKDSNKYVFDSEFLLILWLTHVCTGCNVVDLASEKFGGGVSRMSLRLDIMNDFLFVTFF